MTDKKEKKEQGKFRRYSPQLDEIVVAENKKKREEKVKQALSDKKSK